MPRRSLIGRRPSSSGAAERWVHRDADATPEIPSLKREIFAARLTIDVTQELRGRIKIAAFSSGSTVADLLRQVLQREFGDRGDEA